MDPPTGAVGGSQPAPGESPKEHCRRKLCEVKLLLAHAGLSREPGVVNEGSPLANIVEHKLALRQKIRQHNDRLPYTLGQTNIGDWESPVTVHGFRLQYAYQRSGIDLLEPDLLRAIYPGLTVQTACESRALLLGSGQVGCATAVHALPLLFKRRIALVIPDGVYHETRWFFSCLPHRNLRICERPPRGQSMVVAYLDSSTERPRESAARAATERALDAADLAIIDTTCWDLSSPRLAQLLERLVSAGKTCILVRSHLKLDCLGIDYARLGSLVLVAPTPDSPAEAQVRDTMFHVLRNLVTYYGGYADISQLYPFYRSAEFQAASDRRSAALRHTCAALYQALSDELADTGYPVTLERFGHDLFFYIRTAAEILDIPDCKTVAAGLRRVGAPARVAASFGFDFAAIQSFASQGTTALRIAPGDLPAERIPRAARAIARWAHRRFGPRGRAA